jgi:hypothetical protein
MLFSKEKNPKMEEVRKFASVSKASEFDSLAPHIANAERDYLVPVIGQTMYDELQEFYDAVPPVIDPDADPPAEPTDAQLQTAELLRLSQQAIIHLAYWIGFDLLNAHITDAGFKRTEGTDVKSLFKYQEENLKNYFRTNGFNGLDAVLAYLEKNIETFGEFKMSSACTLFRSAFIPTTEIYNSIIFINKSRLTFLRMKSHMQLIEETEIAPILGPVAFDFVKTEMVKDTPDAKVIALLPYIREPIAWLASALLMEESGADLTDNGLYFTQTTAGYNNDTDRKPSAADRIAILVMRNRSFGAAYLDALRAYLTTHATDWPDVTPSTGRVLRRDNKDKKTFFA